MFYFAYGSNLSMTRMMARCPNAKPVCKATLRFFRLTYKANFRGNGVATILRNPVRRGAVYGALYQISHKELKVLDQYEGYPTIYQRHFVTVETKEFGRIKAITYIMNDYFKPCHPNGYYLAVINQGYRDWKISLEKLAVTP